MLLLIAAFCEVDSLPAGLLNDTIGHPPEGVLRQNIYTSLRVASAQT